MDRNNSIGILLMAVLFIGYTLYSSNKARELQAEEEAKMAEQAKLDSLENIANVEDSLEVLTPDSTRVDTTQNGLPATSIETTDQAKQEFVLENEKLRLTFSNKGGRLIRAELLEFESYKTHYDEDDTEKLPVSLYTENTSKFNWSINGQDTEDLFFEAQANNESVEFTNPATGIVQAYRFNDDNPYLVDYSVSMPDDEVNLEWDTHFLLQEKDMRSDREFTFLAYKTAAGKFKKFKKLKEEASTLVDEPVDYITQRQRFFNQTILSTGAFSDVKLSSSYDRDDQTDFTKLLQSESEVRLNDGEAEFQILISPNEREILKGIDKKLVNIQPAGIFGLTKALAWMFDLFRPMFSNYGLLILVMTLLIKLILTPLTYRSYLSQAKMSVLKPELAELKEKHGDDQARMSQEQMKLYGKAGVNPLGGCLPSVLQIPIFFSLYYFFRSSIFFRQKEFLWAKDLSTYDSVIDLPFNLPLIGGHISLFAILYGIALFFSMRTNRGMMTGGMPAPSTSNKKGGGDMQNMMQMQMKFMQYAMPVFLPLIFNAFPAALTFYYFCYNIINALQTLVIKKFIIDEDKILQKIEKNKEKPKKKSGFRKRIEDAMKAQQELAEKQKKKK